MLPLDLRARTRRCFTNRECVTLVGRVRCAIIVMLLWASSALAQPQPSDLKRAEEAMQRGVAAMGRAEHEVALAAFQEAAKLAPDANVPHKLAGEALEALGRYRDAVVEYRRYIEIKPDAKGVQDVRARIDKLERERLAILEVRCDLAGAFVELDGKPAGKTPLAPITLVAPATVTIAISALGHKRREQRLELPAGTRLPYECKLEPVEGEQTLDSRTPPSNEQPRWYKRWTVLAPAIAVAAAIVGTGVYFLASRPPTTDGGSHTFP